MSSVKYWPFCLGLNVLNSEEWNTVVFFLEVSYIIEVPPTPTHE